MNQNLKRGISVSLDCDLYGRSVVRIIKQRGKLSLDEIEDVLRYGEHGQRQGHYAMLLNCAESTCGGSGWYDDSAPKGDSVDLYRIDSQEDCPVCGNMIPPFEFCPSCGKYWNKEGVAW